MSLIQIALAAEEFFRQQPIIQFTEAQCVRTKDVRAACDRCVERCPTSAITLEIALPRLDADRCIKCGGCSHVCPAGAFEHTDGLYHLLNCAEHMVDRETLDIACAYHPAAEKADRAVDGVIQTSHCLSELGPSAYIGLMTLGVKHTRVRQDACQDCPLRVLQPQIEQNVSHAQRILSAFGRHEGVMIVPRAEAAWRKRPVVQSRNPPVSRRGFFTMFAEGTLSKARAMVLAPDDSQTTSRERQRLLAALRLLIPADTEGDAAATLDTDDFARFTVQDTCTACCLCERVCPVGALHVEKVGAAFTVNFAPHLCTNCGLCVTYCDPGALQFAGRPTASSVLNSVVMPLHTGTLRQCKRCQTLFASQADEELCEVCRHRRDPYSGQLPEALLAKLPVATRERLPRPPAQSDQ